MPQFYELSQKTHIERRIIRGYIHDIAFGRSPHGDEKQLASELGNFPNLLRLYIADDSRNNILRPSIPAPACVFSLHTFWNCVPSKQHVLPPDCHRANLIIACRSFLLFDSSETQIIGSFQLLCPLDMPHLSTNVHIYSGRKWEINKI